MPESSNQTLSRRRFLASTAVAGAGAVIGTVGASVLGGNSFSRGFDGAGLLDQGLAFIAFQRSLHDGLATVQARLSNEPLSEYIQVQGGGYFFVLSGVIDPTGNLGDGLLGSRLRRPATSTEPLLVSADDDH